VMSKPDNNSAKQRPVAKVSTLQQILRKTEQTKRTIAVTAKPLSPKTFAKVKAAG
jgi:hypothetical protein